MSQSARRPNVALWRASSIWLPLLLAEKAGYRVYRLTYPSPVVTPVEQNNTVPADYYVLSDKSRAMADRSQKTSLQLTE